MVLGPGADKMTFCFAPVTLFVMFHRGPTCTKTCQGLRWLIKCPSMLLQHSVCTDLSSAMKEWQYAFGLCFSALHT